MKNYDPNIYCGSHRIRITLQMWNYVGHVELDIGGNCRGRDILTEPDFSMLDDADIKNNDCYMKYVEDTECFCFTLKNENGDICEFNEDSESVNKMIVAIEIINFVEGK